MTDLLHWTEFLDIFGKTLTARSGSWAEMIDRFRTVGTFTSKHLCPWIKGASFGLKRSPIYYDKNGGKRGDSLRWDENVIAVFLIEGDYDGELMPMKEALEKLESYGVRAALYPSPSSTPEKPRWRVFAPLSRQHQPHERAALVARLNGVLGGVLAGESFTISQSYYFGATPTNGYEVLVTFDDPEEGTCIDELVELDVIAVGKQSAPTLNDAKAPISLDMFGLKVQHLGRKLKTGDGRRQMLKTYIASRSRRGLPGADIQLTLRGIADKYFDPTDGVDWDNIDALVDHFDAKDQNAVIDPETGEILPPWGDPVDPFTQYPVPTFPLEVLPKVFCDYAVDCSQASGFDVGAYGFGLMILAGGLIDQRVRLRAGPLSVPPHVWGSLSADSGGGKSPILNAVGFAFYSINHQVVKASAQAIATWSKLSVDEKQNTPKPPFRQLILDNTTIEGAAKAAQDNPEGLTLVLPELSEWFGRMDSYSGGKGSDKDRGAWIRAFDGGPTTINRSSNLPVYLENFSAAMLTGIQPEKLAQILIRSPAGGADGLLQRLLHYAVAEPGKVNYKAKSNQFMQADVETVFRRLYEWRESGAVTSYWLDESAVEAAQTHHNLLRRLSSRTPPGRFAEHIDKLPGLTLRLALGLHVIHAAAKGNERPDMHIPLGTFHQAEAVIRVLYRHSEAVYGHLDGNGLSASIRLAMAACEAILTKHWDKFQRGDLSRDATGWSGVDQRQCEAAIDLLIDWRWILDVTPPTPAGKRGRRSSGLFAVNPRVHENFEPQADRIIRERRERHDAILQLASQRAGGE